MKNQPHPLRGMFKLKNNGFAYQDDAANLDQLQKMMEYKFMIFTMATNIHEKNRVKLNYYVKMWIIIVHDYVTLKTFEVFS